ncbi:hypothetical protein [Paenisporosarcina antarctica]|uniref:hypothetical protein n=1 Tax=Paenisporosarcina antarctica TaxID=417367 RepID=UPI001AB043AF|nr:hypothetical protein [Paenisporosarcina antarctica]
MGIKTPFEVPDEAFMALELQEKTFDNVSGVDEYECFFNIKVPKASPSVMKNKCELKG